MNNALLMSNMEITKTDECRFHVVVNDVYRRLEEDVNDIQLRGMVDGRAVGIMWQQIIDRLDQSPIGYKMTIKYG